MSNIPPELIFDILSRLQPKDLIRYKCVSKAWYAFIHNQDFIKAHHERSKKTNSTRTILFEVSRAGRTRTLDFLTLPFDNDEMLRTATKLGRPVPSKDSWDITNTVGYANGLVCICNYIVGTCIDLWNPSIQKFKKIPYTNHEPHAQPPSPELDIGHNYGFGYDSTNDDYKLVGIVEFDNENGIAVSHQVSVYSLKANSWKRVQDIPSGGYGFTVASAPIVFLNGALSWLMYRELLDQDQYMIVTLDLASEKYRVREFPILMDKSDRDPDLIVLGDYLCICHDFKSRTDVWIMKEYGVTESWTLLFSISLRPHLYMRPLVFSKNGEMVLLIMDHKRYSRLFGMIWRKRVSNELKLVVYPLGVNSQQPSVGRAFVFFLMAILLLLRALRRGKLQALRRGKFQAE